MSSNNCVRDRHLLLATHISGLRPWFHNLKTATNPFFTTHLTCSDGWKAVGLSCWENLGKDPCKRASLTASKIPSCNKKLSFDMV